MGSGAGEGGAFTQTRSKIQGNVCFVEANNIVTDVENIVGGDEGLKLLQSECGGPQFPLSGRLEKNKLLVDASQFSEEGFDEAHDYGDVDGEYMPVAMHSAYTCE